MGVPAMVTLRPGCWTRIPGTRCEVRWDGAEELIVHRRGGVWDLSPASRRPGYALAWARVAHEDRPASPPWPILPLAAPATYRSASGSGEGGGIA